jgi:hypothetical protein
VKLVEQGLDWMWQQMKPMLIAGIEAFGRALVSIYVALGMKHWWHYIKKGIQLIYHQTYYIMNKLYHVISPLLESLSFLIHQTFFVVGFIYAQFDQYLFLRWKRALFEATILSFAIYALELSDLTIQLIQELRIVLSIILSWWWTVAMPTLVVLKQVAIYIGQHVVALVNELILAMQHVWAVLVVKLPHTTTVIATIVSTLIHAMHTVIKLVVNGASTVVFHLSVLVIASLDMCRERLPLLKSIYWETIDVLSLNISRAENVIKSALAALLIWTLHTIDFLYDAGRDGIASMRWWLVRHV